MADFEFCIPVSKESLLNIDSDNIYYVKELCEWSSLKDELKRARDAFQYDGPCYVLDHFNTYFAVLYYEEKVSIEMLSLVVVDLTKSCTQLINNLESILDEAEIEPELQIKSLNVLKMSVYLYSHTLIALENKLDEKNKQNLNLVAKGRKGSKKNREKADEISPGDKRKYISILVKMLQLNIFKLWDPPVCEETFVNLFAEVGFTFLQNPLVNVKADEETVDTIFGMFGVLLKSYNYSLTFSVRLVAVVRMYEHLMAGAARGVVLLVQDWGCRSLVRELVREFTEWQADEAATQADAAGSRNCSSVLVELTCAMPELMLPEVEYMLQYLSYTSYTLRNCVLSIIVEVVLQVLSAEGMSEERREIRDEMLAELRAHLLDVNGHVRTRVLQHWTRLCQAGAIPTRMRTEVVRAAVSRLRDKASNVRRGAMQLLAAFIENNLLLSNNLNLDELEVQLQTLRDKLEGMHVNARAALSRSVTEREQQWRKIEPKVRAAVEARIGVATEQDDELCSKPCAEMALPALEQFIREFIRSGRYEDAFMLCRRAKERLVEGRVMGEEQVEMFVSLMCSVYVDGKRGMETELSTEELAEWQLAERAIAELEDVCDQLHEIDAAIEPLRNLLRSATMSDVHEAIRFFVVANAFKIKRASEGMTTMLILIQSTEEERRKAVIQAYKNVFLGGEQSRAPPIEVANKLLSLVETVTLETQGDLTQIVAEWARNGDLEAGVMEHLWTLVTHASEQRVAALQLLSMAAHGRKLIIERNMNLVVELAFPDTATDVDMRMVLIGCQMLSLMGSMHVDTTSEKPLFRLHSEHAMFTRLFDIMYACMTRPQERLYPAVTTAAIDLIFKVCRKPDVICTNWIKRLFSVLKCEDGMTSSIELSRFVHMLGEMAMRQFMFLDVTLYKELKRRAYLRETRSKDARINSSCVQSMVGTPSMNISKASASSRLVPPEDLDASYMEGAAAEDDDAEFVLKVCENNVVSDETLLGHFTPLLLAIVRNTEGHYDNENLQAAASLALAKYMLVSSRVCEEHMRQLMTVLERSKYPDVRTNVLVAMADLLRRFPNVVEPWCDQLYKRVQDSHEPVRTTAVTMLTTLLLEDMLRVKGGTVADLALCIRDTSAPIRDMAKRFFQALARKGNSIYNIMPDVISRLSNDSVSEEAFREVMDFLIKLIDKDRQIEPLVEKLCTRFTNGGGVRHWRDLTYCLKELNHTERSLERLVLSHSVYKDALEDEQVNTMFLQLAQRHVTKDEQRATVARQLQQLLLTGHLTEAEDDQQTTTKQQPRSRKTSRKKKLRV